MFKDYAELAGELLQLPINGKTYTIPAISAKNGIQAQQLIQRSLNGESIPMSELAPLVMGPAYQQMLDDDVPAAAFTRAQLTALADFQSGRKAAEVTWETSGDPKELKRFLKEKTTKRDGATTTPKPASTNGTKRKTSPKKRTRES